MNPQDQKVPSDYMETMSASNPSTPDVPPESPTSEYDAGVDDEALGKDDSMQGEFDQASPGEISEDNSREYSRREIPVSDLPDAPREDFIHSPELSDMNTPGEVDIEDLDEDAVSEVLPADARLNRLQD